MALTDIETLVLELMGENLTVTDNWTGTDELRDELSDALDEICMRNEFLVEQVRIPLQANTTFYVPSKAGFYPLWFKRARLLEQDRDLEFTSLERLALLDRKWYNTSGSPYQIVALSPQLVAIYPRYSTDGGVVELDCIGTRRAYEDEKVYHSLTAQFEEALICYGKYFCYMRTAGGEEKAMKEFEEYLRLTGTHQDLSWHKRMISAFRLKALGE